MNVEIVDFPETKIAVFEHHGSPALEEVSLQRFVKWRKRNKLPPSDENRSYGIHYTDATKVEKNDYRVDIAVSIAEDIEENTVDSVFNKVIPELRCAKVRHVGSRDDISSARELHDKWLPKSGEKLADFPIFFHYVNVGEDIAPEEMITDVYLPIK